MDIGRKHKSETVAALESKVEALERKYEMQAARHKELSHELHQLKRQSSLSDLTLSENLRDRKTTTELQTTPHEIFSLFAQPDEDSMLRSPTFRTRTINVSPKHSATRLNRMSAPVAFVEQAQQQQQHPLYQRCLSSNALKYQDNCKQPSPCTDLAAWVSENAGRLFRAKYSYQPAKDSPNENPEVELSLHEGDFLLIHGADADGFFDGELLNGKRGLVPSNFVERVPDHELFTCFPSTSKEHTVLAPTPSSASNFYSSSRTSSAALRPFASSSSTTVNKSDANFPSNSPKISSVVPITFGLSGASTSTNSSTTQPPSTNQCSDFPCPYPAMDVSNVTVHEVKQPDGDNRVPHPRDLLVERQLLKSVVISWSPPDNSLVQVSQYHVCIDGIVKAVVPGTYKTKALVEDVDYNKTQRLSVRTVTEFGHSADAACTVMIGKDAIVSPQDLKSTNVSPVSAQINWYPSNSNLEHIILLNGVKVGACPAAVYVILLKGLIPSTMYRCSVRVKNPRAVLEEKPVESCVDFKTLPKIGLPDAPTDVKCEWGPQDGTLLITWSPTSTQPKPPSRAAVSGYLVYADGRKIKEVDSPNGDHVLLRLSDFFDDPPLYITVRTRTREGAISCDSNVVRVPRSHGANVPSFSPVHYFASASGSASTSNAFAPSSSLPSSVHVSPLHPSSAAPAAIGSIPQTASINPPISSMHGAEGRGGGSGGLLMVQPPQSQVPSAIRSIQQKDLKSSATFSAGTPSNFVPSTQVSYPSYVQMPLCSSAHWNFSDVGAATVLPAFPASGDGSSANLNSLPDRSRLQYYVFHPQLARVEPDVEKPSLLEMENSYLAKHLQQSNAVHTALERKWRNLPVINPQTGFPFRNDQYDKDRSPIVAFDTVHRRFQHYVNEPSSFGTNVYNSSVKQQRHTVDQLERRRAAMRKRSYSADDELKAQAGLSMAPMSAVYAEEEFDSFPVHPEIQVIRANGSEGGGRSHIDFPQEAFVWQQNHSTDGYAQADRRSIGRRPPTNRALSEPDLRTEDVHMALPEAAIGSSSGKQRPYRLFEALYDYSPRHMSPNPNAAIEELSFRKGQIIKIFTQMDSDGFYRGELSGRIGFVPGNLVSELADYSMYPTSTADVNSPYPNNRRPFPAGSPHYPPSGLMRHYYERDSRYWPQNSSDPSLAQKQFERSGYADYLESKGQGQDSRTRRARLKQKSHSLDYDLEHEKSDEVARSGESAGAYAMPVSSRRATQTGDFLRPAQERFAANYAPQARHANPVRSPNEYAYYTPPTRQRYVDEGAHGASPSYSHYNADNSRPEYASAHDSRGYRRDMYTSADRYPMQASVGSRHYPGFTEHVRRKLERYGPDDRSRSLDYYEPPMSSDDVEKGFYSLDRGRGYPAKVSHGNDQTGQAAYGAASKYPHSEQVYDRRREDRFYRPVPVGEQRRNTFAEMPLYYDNRRALPKEAGLDSDSSNFRRQTPQRRIYEEAERRRGYGSGGGGGVVNHIATPETLNGGRDQDIYEGEYTNRYQSQQYSSIRGETSLQDQRKADHEYRTRADYYEDRTPGKTRGSFRKEGRDKLEQSIRNLVREAPPRRTIALYDYDPRESSPNVDAEMELNFRAGDLITVYGDVDDDGFFVGEIGGRRGLVPSNFLAADSGLPVNTVLAGSEADIYESPRSKKDGVTFSDNSVPGLEAGVDSPSHKRRTEPSTGTVPSGTSAAASSIKLKLDSTSKPVTGVSVKASSNRMPSQSSTASKTSSGSSGSAAGKAVGSAKGTAMGKSATKSGAAHQKKSLDASSLSKASPSQQRKASMPAAARAVGAKVASKIMK